MLLVPRFYSIFGSCCQVVMLQHEGRSFSNILGLCDAWGVTPVLQKRSSDVTRTGANAQLDGCGSGGYTGGYARSR
jgi:hypothetical protein